MRGKKRSWRIKEGREKGKGRREREIDKRREKGEEGDRGKRKEKRR